MKLSVLTVFIPLFLSANLYASVIVVKSSSKSSRALLKRSLSDKVNKGDFLSIGENCDLEVLKVQKSKIIAETSLCTDKEVLKKGAIANVDTSNIAISPSSSEMRTQVSPKQQGVNKLKFNTFTLSILSSPSINYKGNGNNGEISIKESIRIGNEFGRITHSNWGALLGVHFTIGSQIDSVKEEGANVLAEGSKPSIMEFVLEPQIAYGFSKNMFVSAGINYPIFIDNLNWDISGKIGYQAAGNYVISDFLLASLSFINKNYNVENVGGTYSGSSNTLRLGLGFIY